MLVAPTLMSPEGQSRRSPNVRFQGKSRRGRAPARREGPCADSCTAAKCHCSSGAGALLGCRRGPSGGGTDWPGAHDALTHGGGQRDHEVATDHLDLDGPQTHARVALMLTGGDVELVAVPG